MFYSFHSPAFSLPLLSSWTLKLAWPLLLSPSCPLSLSLSLSLSLVIFIVIRHQCRYCGNHQNLISHLKRMKRGISWTLHTHIRTHKHAQTRGQNWDCGNAMTRDREQRARTNTKCKNLYFLSEADRGCIDGQIMLRSSYKLINRLDMDWWMDRLTRTCSWNNALTIWRSISLNT